MWFFRLLVATTLLTAKLFLGAQAESAITHCSRCPSASVYGVTCKTRAGAVYWNDGNKCQGGDLPTGYTGSCALGLRCNAAAYVYPTECGKLTNAACCYKNARGLQRYWFPRITCEQFGFSGSSAKSEWSDEACHQCLGPSY